MATISSCDAQPFPLLRFPSEVVHNVIDFVDDRQQVLALALTCQSLKITLIPDHLDYRVLKVSFSNLDLLERLIARPSLARNVRSIAICHGPHCSSLMDDRHRCSHSAEGEAVAERALCSAFGLMGNLTRLEWWLLQPRYTKDLIWETIKESCPRLRELVVRDFEHCQRSVSLSKLVELRNLEEVEMDLAFRPDMPSPVKCLRTLLAHCPTLHTLKLTFTASQPHIQTLFNLEDIFLHASLPRLRSLQLHGVCSDPSIFKSFLGRHPTIENLATISCADREWGFEEGMFTIIDETTLPNLHTLLMIRIGAIPLLDPILMAANWPRLHSIWLYGFSASSAILASFLIRHPAIEYVSFISNQSADSSPLFTQLPIGSLPNLHKFESYHDEALAICDSAPPIETLGVLNAERVQFESRATVQALQKVAPTLRTIYFEGLEDSSFDVAEMLRRKVPGVTAEWKRFRAPGTT
ncbi:hypothetical protein JAAARDRAFT_60397 [Jaapia argillacea MUCL 33604]|uniref:F-box domain-containing protein n=1 Tax=Jaapia argillacea MUCL 33604 TaxID=933084 RepID=A0A067PJJ3_9AGAM|nr:hypothetical protein JAAARDRAFT_60397 [Jaapia argillacea MUCL 33604]